MKIVFLVLTIIFSLSTSIVNAQTVANKEKEFPEELKTKWYYQFVEELKLTPQDFSEFGRFFLNGTLVSGNESRKVYVNGIAILNNTRTAKSNFGEFEVYYFSVFKAIADYEIFFEKVEFWEEDKNGKIRVSKSVNSKEGHYYTQYYQSDYDVLCTEELYINSDYEDMLKAYNIE